MKTIILAGNIEEFNNYIRALELSPDDYIYGEPHSIQPIHAKAVTTIGTFWERKDASDLINLAKSRIR